MILKRRTFLLASTAALIAGPAFSGGGGFTKYTPGLVDQLLSEGKTVFIDYGAEWCSTCARQERVILSLLDENPNYAKHVAFVHVDWDDYRRADITTANNIPRRSTLIVLKGDQELGRIVAGTSKDDIQALMDTALTAATSS